MKEYVFLTGTAVFTMFLTLILQVLTLNLTRSNIYLGVRIPEDKRDDKELKKLGKEFTRANFLFGIPLIGVLSILIYITKNIGVYITAIFGYILFIFLIYYYFNNKVKELKAKNSWLNTKKQEVIIDTKFSREKRRYAMPSSWWFIIPLIIIAVNIAVNLKYYEFLPSIVPTHWDFNGQVNGYQHKSGILIYEMPLFQLFMTGILFISFKGIGWSKQELSGINPEESKERNKIFRRAWGIYFIITTIAVNLIFTVGDFQIMQVAYISNTISTFLISGFTMFIIGGSIIISVKVGQGGSKLKFPNEKNEEVIFHRDDDKYWLLANSIYYNPEDPSVFVEKRFGIGWTVNAGTFPGKAIYAGTILLLIIPLVICFILEK
ncbi:MAG: DUF1648 domain-containing protein [Solirubrobacterales bacterium]